MSEAFQDPVYKQVGSLSRGLKIACLYKQIVSGRVTLLPGNELRPVSFNKCQQNEEAVFQKHSWCTHVSSMFHSFPYGKHCLQCFCFLTEKYHVFVFKMQIMLTLHGREFEPKSEHASTCKNFASTSK